MTQVYVGCVFAVSAYFHERLPTTFIKISSHRNPPAFLVTQYLVDRILAFIAISYLLYASNS
ncbi:hypothetical protein L208DRAFT_1402390 [Tricholoma matsutake]|nr:hypothetical protein L208DRAFT_1402390 [Tricholoma matsutake 945]